MFKMRPVRQIRPAWAIGLMTLAALQVVFVNAGIHLFTDASAHASGITFAIAALIEKPR